MILRRKHIYILLLCLVGATMLLSSCDDDDFSNDESLRLEMGTETVNFDTVFTTIGSATKRFKVYNRNSKSLTIQSVRLKHATESGFRMNIDGQKGTLLNDVEILKKDSLFAFVEITVDPLKNGNPTIIRDTIEFLTNGNRQEVYLEAVGQNVHMWHGKVISTSTRLSAEKPYLIYDSLVVSKDTRVEIEKGAKFYFRRDASFKIYGSVEAKGTVEKPIVLRGDRFDEIDAGVSYDNVSGQWDGIFIYANSYNNRFENVDVRNAKTGMMFYRSEPTTKKATFINAIVRNTSGTGVTAINCDIDAANSLFVNSKGSSLSLIGGKYNFNHCTIANYYKWSARQKEALTIGNTYELVQLPLLECNITNTIVYGNAVNELRLDNNTGVPFNFQFQNSLLKFPQTSDPQFLQVVRNADPLFKTLNEEGNYVYDFDLKENSPAIAKAAVGNVSTDIRGRQRKTSMPDIGCYEFTK